jgi:hypothetical protein
MVREQETTDHDLLIRLDQKVDILAIEIKELKDGLADRILLVEKEKLDTKDSYPILYKGPVEATLNDHETRIRFLEKIEWRIIGGAAAISAVVGFLMPFVLKYL